MTSSVPDRSSKGIVFDIKRYALHDGPGIRVSVHFKGCPLHCDWCHNPESQKFEPQVLFRPDKCIHCGTCEGKNEADAAKLCPPEAREMCGTEMSVGDVMKQIEKERVFFDQSGGGVTLTGGEPLAQPEFAASLAAECASRRIGVAVDTCGFASWSAFEGVLPYTDLFLYDIKHMDPEAHKKYTGVDNALILENLKKLGESGARIFARLPFIPGINTDDAEIEAAASFLAGVRGVEHVNLLPYHSAASDKHARWGMEFRLGEIFPPTSNSLNRASEIFGRHGLTTVIGG